LNIIINNRTKPANFLLTPQFLLANLIFFLALTGNQIFLLYPLRLQELGKNQAQIGFIMGIITFAAFIARPFMGSRMDRYGRRIFILLGSFLTAGIILLYALPVTQTSYLSFVRFIHGIAYAAFFSAMFTWVADYSPKERLTEGIGIFGISGLLPSATGPLLAEQLLNLFNNNYLLLFFAASALTLTGCFLALWLKDPPRPSAIPAFGFRGLLRRFDIITAAFVGIIFGSATGVINNFFSTYSKAAVLGSVASFFTAYTLGAILIRIFAARASDRLGKTKLIFPALIIMGLGQIALVHPFFKDSYLLIGVLLGSGHGMIYPAMNALAVERAGEHDRGSGNAIILSAVDLGTFAGSVLFGEVAKRLGFIMMYRISGATVILGLIIFLILEKIICKICVDTRYKVNVN
jgi:MFS family permease